MKNFGLIFLAAALALTVLVLPQNGWAGGVSVGINIGLPFPVAVYPAPAYYAVPYGYPVVYGPPVVVAGAPYHRYHGGPYYRYYGSRPYARHHKHYR